MSIAEFAPVDCFAQGGPPVVTDDPGTPGDGKWEINLAATYAKTRGRSELAAPDVDVNYGIGEHLQLKLEIPWLFVNDTSVGGRQTGPGAGDVGIKWRFIDEDDAGFAMSTYPSYARYVTPSSVRRGTAPEHSAFYLPLQATIQLGDFGFDGEVGRNFIAHESGTWAAGIVVAHACGTEIECLAEVRESFAPHDHQTLINFGVRARLTESLNFLGAAGRDVDGPRDDRRSALIYLGLQFLR
jgi:hypothetical protein